MFLKSLLSICLHLHHLSYVQKLKDKLNKFQHSFYCLLLQFILCKHNTEIIVLHCWKVQRPAPAAPLGRSRWSSVPSTRRPRLGTGCHLTPPIPPTHWERCSAGWKTAKPINQISRPNQIFNHVADFKRRCPTVENGTNLMSAQSMTCCLQVTMSCTASAADVLCLTQSIDNGVAMVTLMIACYRFSETVCF